MKSQLGLYGDPLWVYFADANNNTPTSAFRRSFCFPQVLLQEQSVPARARPPPSVQIRASRRPLETGESQLRNASSLRRPYVNTAGVQQRPEYFFFLVSYSWFPVDILQSPRSYPFIQKKKLICCACYVFILRFPSSYLLLFVLRISAKVTFLNEEPSSCCSSSTIFLD